MPNGAVSSGGPTCVGGSTRSVRRGRPGLPALAALLDRTEGRPLGDSWLEQEAIRLITHAGLPVPRGPGPPASTTPAGRIGRSGARVDLLWEDNRLVAEISGQETHASRQTTVQAEAERGSDLGSRGTGGVVTFVYEDVVERPAYVVDRIRAHLAVAALTVVLCSGLVGCSNQIPAQNSRTGHGSSGNLRALGVARVA